MITIRNGVLAALVLVGGSACSSSSNSAETTVTSIAPTVVDVTTTIAATTTSAAPTTTVVTTTTVAAIAEGPTGDAFYRPNDDQLAGEPGSIIWTSKTGDVDGGTQYRVLYRSRSLAGDPIAVSGVLIVPSVVRPDAPILTWAHGTSGSADKCALSKLAGATAIVPGATDLLAKGFVLAGTDYEGLGTPGLHPYLVGASEGRGVLDAARAARSFTDATGPVVVWGHSQGGQAAIWAGQIAPDYAPDLDVVGVVAVAPASQIAAIGAIAVQSNALAGFAVPALAGMAAAHPELRLADVLGDQALAAIDVLESGCSTEYFATFGAVTDKAVRVDPSTLADWGPLVAANDAGAVKMAMPLLVAQGDADSTVPKGLNDGFVADACASGSVVDYRVYKGLDHGSVMVAPQPDMIAWMVDRIAGAPATSTCPG